LVCEKEKVEAHNTAPKNRVIIRFISNLFLLDTNLKPVGDSCVSVEKSDYEIFFKSVVRRSLSNNFKETGSSIQALSAKVTYHLEKASMQGA
jgi:hypothetical protein